MTLLIVIGVYMSPMTTNMFCLSNVIRMRSFSHSWFIGGFGKRVTRRVLILPEHLSSPSVFSGLLVDKSLVICVVLCRLLLVFLSFFLSCLMIQTIYLDFSWSFYLQLNSTLEYLQLCPKKQVFQWTVQEWQAILIFAWTDNFTF